MYLANDQNAFWVINGPSNSEAAKMPNRCLKVVVVSMRCSVYVVSVLLDWLQNITEG